MQYSDTMTNYMGYWLLYLNYQKNFQACLPKSLYLYWTVVDLWEENELN